MSGYTSNSSISGNSVQVSDPQYMVASSSVERVDLDSGLASIVSGLSLIRTGDFVGIGTNGAGISAVTTWIPNPSTLYLIPLVLPVSLNVDQVQVEVTTAGQASSVCEIALYASTSTGLPGAFVGSGTVAADALGGKTLSLVRTLPVGRVWVGFCNNDAGGTLAMRAGTPVTVLSEPSIGPSYGRAFGMKKTATTVGALPASLDGQALTIESGTAMPIFRLRVA